MSTARSRSNGASGGVGTFAVQIADHVIDYTQEDFTAGPERYDLILDNVGNHSLLEPPRKIGGSDR